jgi:hypothetical protein
LLLEAKLKAAEKDPAALHVKKLVRYVFLLIFKNVEPVLELPAIFLVGR